MEIPKQLKQRGINYVLIEKGCKKPFQQSWQNKILEYDNPELLIHLSSGGNYGIRGGGAKRLMIIDFDDDKVQEEALKQLPPTFTVKTGSGMLHKYYMTEVDAPESFKGFNENLDTLFDVQGEGKQVIGPGSLHPNGNRYVVIEDLDIQPISYSELKAIMMAFDRKPKKEEPKRLEHKERHIEDNFLEEVKRKVSVQEVLSWLGVDTTRNPTQCPMHNSSGGKCLGFKTETCHCFHCDGSWNIFSLIMDSKKVNFKETLEILAKIGNLEKELAESRKRYIEKMKAENNYKFQQLKQEYVNIIASKNDSKWGQASEVLAQFIMDEMWIYTTKDDLKSEVWIFKEGIYIPQGRSEIKELLRKILEEYYSAYIFNLVMNKIEPDTFIEGDKFFKSRYPNEVPVENGILNIRTLELSPFDPEKIFFNKMPVTFDITKTCPKIDKFLKEVLSKENDVNILYELAGFGLLDEYRFEKAFMMHGDGRNGKGKTIELTKKLFGPDNCCSVQLSALKTDSFSISELFGKRLNLAGDIGSQDLKETNMFKSLTGRDQVSSKRKFLRDLHFQNNAKFVFACNELPMVYDTSKGFWDRWILLDFPYTFVTQEEYNRTEDRSKLKIRDEDIINKITIKDEMSGFLNQALLGLQRLIDNHGFSTTEGSEEVKQRWIRKSNSFIAFCFDMLEEDYDGRVSKKSLRKKYADYCKLHKIPGKSDFVIKRVLQETYGASESREALGDMATWDWFWLGVKWKQ